MSSCIERTLLSAPGKECERVTGNERGAVPGDSSVRGFRKSTKSISDTLVLKVYLYLHVCLHHFWLSFILICIPLLVRKLVLVHVHTHLPVLLRNAALRMRCILSTLSLLSLLFVSLSLVVRCCLAACLFLVVRRCLPVCLRRKSIQSLLATAFTFEFVCVRPFCASVRVVRGFSFVGSVCGCVCHGCQDGRCRMFVPVCVFKGVRVCDT